LKILALVVPISFCSRTKYLAAGATTPATHKMLAAMG